MGTPRRWRTILLPAVLASAAGGLALSPRACSTAAAQLGLGFGRSPEWMQAAYGGPSPRLDRFAAARPEDVELQIALATLPALLSFSDDTGRERQADEPSVCAWSWLEHLARRFPEHAPVRAHLLRHLCLATRLLRHRTEQQEVMSGPPDRSVAAAPAPETLRLLDTVAIEGERLEPDNAFFAFMRAVAAFAARRDSDALRHLHALAGKPSWNDYAMGETSAQLRLFRETYGDQGVIQKFMPSNGLLFPHFADARAVARLALFRASRHERAGNWARARAIRRDIMGLGAAIADGSPSVIGRQVGMAIFRIGLASVPPRRSPTPEEREHHERGRREQYIADAAAEGKPALAEWVRATGDRMDALERRRRAWIETTYQEVSACWPRLAAWWMLGVGIGWQVVTLLLLSAIGALLARVSSSASALADAVSWGLAYLTLFLSPALAVLPGWWRDVLTASAESIPAAELFWGFCLAGVLALAQWRARRRLMRDHPAVEMTAGGSERGWHLPTAVAAVLPSLTLSLVLLGAQILSSDNTSPFAREARLMHMPLTVAAEYLYPFHDIVCNLGAEGPRTLLPLVLLAVSLPVIPLLFLSLCRTAAQNLPLCPGLGQELRQTAPVAALLLALIYLASLSPTLAADRAVEQNVEQTMTDELAVMPARR